MAITRVNSVSVSGFGASGAITVTVPGGTGIQAGDLIVACCVSNGTHVANGMTVKDSVNGTNYTALLETDESNSSSFFQNTKYFQTPVNIADGSTFTFTPFASYNNAGIAIDIFRGCSGAIDQAATGNASSPSTTIACPALGSNATAGALVLSLAAGGGAVTLTQSTLTTGSVNTTDRSCGIAYNLSASGSSTYAVNWTQGSSSSWAGQTVSFTAAATTSVPPDVPQITPGPTWLDLFKPFIQRPRPVPPALQSVNASGSLALAPLALSGTGAQTSPDQPQVQPGTTWLDLFKPWAQKPRPVPPAVQGVSAAGSFALAPLAFSGSAGQTSPDLPQAAPGPVWIRLFRPDLYKPVPPPPATPSVSATGSFALAPLALQAQGAQTSPDQPAVQPGTTWLDLFKPGLQKPRPVPPALPAVTSSGSFAVAPLGLSGTGVQSNPDVTQAQPGPVWLRLFRPWVQRPLPPPPAFQSVNATGSFTLGPLAFSATAGQSSPDQPSAQPGPSWTRLFRPQVPRPLPPLPAAQAVSAAGSFSLAPLALSGTGAQTSPDQPQIQPGPFWLRLLRPQVRRPVPPVPAVQSVTSTGSFALAPLALSGTEAGPPQDLPQVVPGPAWLRFFKPWVPRPVPPVPPPSLPPPATSTGSFSLAALALSAQGGQSSTDIPQADPGPSWLRFFRPWIHRPLPPVPAVQSVTSSGSFALAPLALSGQAAQSSQSAPDQPLASPGPSWLRFFRPWQPKPYPPTPATPAVSASGSFPLAPVALSGTGTATGGGPADQPQAQPGPWWLRLFKPWVPRPVPAPPSAPVTAAPQGEVLFSLGPARQAWTAGRAQQAWTAGEARQTWTAGRAQQAWATGQAQRAWTAGEARNG